MSQNSAGLGSQTFGFSPLPQGKWIRIMVLEPGSFDDPINCAIQVLELVEYIDPADCEYFDSFLGNSYLNQVGHSWQGGGGVPMD